MKTIFESISILCAGLAVTLFTSMRPEEKPFEGVITYSIEFPTLPEEYKTMLANSELIMYMKPGKTRSDMNTTFMNQTSIADQKQGTVYQLFEDMNGDKFYVKSKAEEVKKDEITVKKINYLEETKTIAGYACKKAEVITTGSDGKEKTLIVFYTETIGSKLSGKTFDAFKGLKGMAMEFEITAGSGQTLKLTAKSVSRESVSDSKFSIPDSYKEITEEEWKEKQQKMSQGG